MVFGNALLQMPENDVTVWGPTSFRDYLENSDIATKRRTPELISVDHLESLSSELRNRDVMVFRLGRSSGTGTQFALVQVPGALEDFFFLDAAIFGKDRFEPFVPERRYTDLFPFLLIPNLSETNLLNLALASGLIGRALNLEKESAPNVPATGNMTATFTFRPHSQIRESLSHKSGQVQIDAAFMATREGHQSLFVVEAKVAPSPRIAGK